MDEIKKYIEDHKQQFLDELFELIRIPSISSEKEHKDDMKKTADKLKEKLMDAGADKAEVMPTDGNPVVYGEKILDQNKPTVLVYGHYDVMPVDPIDQWESKPFEPEIRDGKIYARGADDDKGQSFMHVKAFEYMVQSGKLDVNVKFMLEGEEEIGSPSLNSCWKARKKLDRPVWRNSVNSTKTCSRPIRFWFQTPRCWALIIPRSPPGSGGLPTWKSR